MGKLRTLSFVGAGAILAFVFSVACGGGGGGGGGSGDAVLSSLSISPSNPGVLLWQQSEQPFTATGHYSDGSTQDMTAVVTWDSSAPSVAAVSNSIGLEGLTRCVTFGSTTISAQYGSFSDATTLTVTRSVKLPRSGQTVSYGPGDDGDLQKGIRLSDPRFVDRFGDGTVSDTLTGLMWLMDANCIASHYPSLTEFGHPAGTVEWQEALDFIEGINDGTYPDCSSSTYVYTDWRLPNVNELVSLTNFGEANKAAWLMSAYGFTNVQANEYHSSSRYMQVENYCVSMSSGGLGRGSIVNVHYVWPVRTEADIYRKSASLPRTGVDLVLVPGEDGDQLAGIPWPSPRFEAGQGTEADCITDRLTGLVWVASPGRVDRTWSGALAYADSLSLCGHNDWRLPNKNEFMSLHNFSQCPPCTGEPTWLLDQGFTNVESLLTHWTSTTYAGNTDYAWVYQPKGGFSTGAGLKMSDNPVWPVRGGPADRELVVASITSNAVRVLDPDLPGSVYPMRDFTAFPSMSNPSDVAVDAVNGEVFVTDYDHGAILVFALEENGTLVTAMRSISGSTTGLFGPRSVAVDPVNDEIAVTDGSGPSAKVLIFSRIADGAAAPVRTIAGTNTLLDYPQFVEIDADNGEILVTDLDAQSVFAFSRTADGDISPERIITGSNTLLTNPAGLALDLTNDELLVVNMEPSPAVLVFARMDNGDVAPLRTLAGSTTGMDDPVDVAVDPVGAEIMVSNFGTSSVTVYSRTADGDVAPLRTIRGNETGLMGPGGMDLTQ